MTTAEKEYRCGHCNSSKFTVDTLTLRGVKLTCARCKWVAIASSVPAALAAISEKEHK